MLRSLLSFFRTPDHTAQHDHCHCWPCCEACAHTNSEPVPTDTAPGTIIDNRPVNEKLADP